MRATLLPWAPAAILGTHCTHCPPGHPLSWWPYSVTVQGLTKQLLVWQVIPAAGSNFIHVSFTPMVLPGSVSKMVCNSYALGFMSLDDKVSLRSE